MFRIRSFIPLFIPLFVALLVAVPVLAQDSPTPSPDGLPEWAVGALVLAVPLLIAGALYALYRLSGKIEKSVDSETVKAMLAEFRVTTDRLIDKAFTLAEERAAGTPIMMDDEIVGALRKLLDPTPPAEGDDSGG